MTSTEPKFSREDYLRKVRGLLAKAEGASTEEEAETFSAKAMALMARWGIDAAMIAASDPKGAMPDALADRVITMPGHFPHAKMYLLNLIALAHGCRAIRKDTRIAGKKGHTILLFGYTADLDTVEMLYTSLLVQSANALGLTPIPPYESVHKFKRAWYRGFANTVATRLREAREYAARQAEGERVSGPSVELVLLDRKKAVDVAFHQKFPHLRSGRAASVTGTGYGHGASAGARADLGGTRLNAASPPRNPRAIGS